MHRLGVVHLSTVHPRDDIRIFVKQVTTLYGALGQQVGLVVADGKGDARPAAGPWVLDLGKLPTARSARALAGNWRALRLLLRLRPAVVHFHDPELLLLGMVLRLLGYRVVYDVHEDVPRQTMGKDWIPYVLRWPVARAVAAMEWLAGRTFAAIVPATPVIGARFPSARTVLVQNFPIQAELVAPQAVAYGQRPLVFAYVGGIADIRGGAEMVAAMDLLSDRPGVRLELAGAIRPDAFATRLQRLPGWQRAVHHGQINRADVATLLGRARAGLVLFHPLPNHVDAQPNKMFEYMSAGLPVVASDFPLWRQIVAGAGCGLLVNPLDPSAIADALRWVVDHPIEAEAMGQRGRDAVQHTYNWERESAQLLSLYSRLLAP